MGDGKFIFTIGTIRVISGLVEFLAALLILRVARVEDAVRINTLLGLVGPAVFLVAMAVGLAGMAERLSLAKAVLLLSGVALILAATRQ